MMKPSDPRYWIERLSRIDRGSCSPGESRAAELIAQALRAQGAEVTIERPRVHGTYWWPLGITSGLGVIAASAARAGRGRIAVLLGTVATAAVIDDLEVRGRWLRRVLPKRPTTNVLAWTGDPRAQRTLIVVAHHDASHTGVFFHPAIGEATAAGVRRNGRSPAVQLPLAAGPALAALSGLPGLRRAAALSWLVCVGIVASLANIATSRTVAGANDNLTGVATLLALAERLRDQPAPGLRVLLLSTGAEEALMEGMNSFTTRHLGQMDRECTHVLCVDSVGSPHLSLPEGQGMLRIRHHDPSFRRVIADCAAEGGIHLSEGPPTRLGTDGYPALIRGFRTALLMSVNDSGVTSNYHWPTDTAERVDYATLNAAFELCERVVRRLASGGLIITGEQSAGR